MKEKKIRCLACQRMCFIPSGETGFCKTRQNRKGKIYSLTYGVTTGIQIDPVEKKPLYHFHPGEPVASFGSLGCNFRCKQCLNYSHSWGATIRSKPAITPQKLINQVKKGGWPGIAFTYNEPAINPEFVHDTAKLAKKEDLFTVFVTNGSWTKKALDDYGKYLDAANIDFKGFSQKTYARQGAFFGQIPKMALYAQKKYKIHLEVTTLLIPTINNHVQELKKMTEWIVKNLGPKTPWHLSRFDPQAAPDEKFRQIPATTVGQLQKAAQIGQKAGLKFVYIWAPGANGGLFSQADTICPQCGNLAISRSGPPASALSRRLWRAGWQPHIIGLDKNGHCPDCNENLNVKI